MFAFWQTSAEMYWSMKRSASGAVMVVVYICMSAQNFGYVSGLATSDEKNTDAVTDFSSRSTPAFWQDCLTIACSFWRVPLMDVW